MRPATNVVEIECDDARDLLAKLRDLVLSPPYGLARARRWAFRGQRDAQWRLLPSAYREGTELGYQHERFGARVTGKDLQSYEQTQAEFNAVAEFLQLADQAGLPVPGDTQVFRLNANGDQNVLGHTLGTEDWPHPELLETLAIAQHHGVPTRLLDFSYSPEVASYFGALDVGRHREGKEGCLAVWALDMDFLQVGSRLDRGNRLIRVTVPRAHNAFLHAQHGFFIYDKYASRHDMPALDDAVATIAEEYYANREIYANHVPLDWRPGYSFRLPWRHATELLHLLAVLGVDQAHLQPSYDNIVTRLRSLRSEITSERPFPPVPPERR